MKDIVKFGKYIFVLVLCLSLFGVTKVYAEETESTDEVKYTMTIDPNGGIPGPEFQDTIVLSEGENYPVGGSNEEFLKAPEGKGFSGIEIIDKDGNLVTIADGVLLWGYDFCDGETLVFHWGDLISDVELTFEYPEVGSETTTPEDEYGNYITDEQTNKPAVTVSTEYGMEIAYLEWVDNNSYVEEYEYYDTPYIGTFEGGNKYYALVDVYVNSLDYALTDTINVKVNGENVNAYKAISYSTGASITLEIELEDNSYKVIEGANQEVLVGEEAEFEIDADFGLFEDGGEVYVDDNLLEAEKDYTAKEGSTIITLTKDYMNTLSEGTHTLKVLFNDDKTATTTFTVTKTNTEITPPNTGVEKETTTIYELFLLIVGCSVFVLRKRFN